MVEVEQPLADRVRPATLLNIFGQRHLLAPGKPLFQALHNGPLHSMVLWGPPGCGKTTLARLLAGQSLHYFEALSAVQSGIKELRAVMEAAEKRLQLNSQRTVVFIDEIHRYNKSQQDALLPYVEDGRIILVGATTENPSFELNNALLSRLRVYTLQALEPADLTLLLRAALAGEQGFRGTIQVCEGVLEKIAVAADGDARQALNFLELCAQTVKQTDAVITDAVLESVATAQPRRFDKQGDAFYEHISALHKSVRGTDPDAALYWYARMLDGGCDPLYIARRVVRMASEDIGIADPRALPLALNAWDTQERLGSPEGELAIAQAIVYLSCAPKSNAVYIAFAAAKRDVQQFGALPVPVHLRNASTRLMRQMGYGKNYRYDHDEGDGYAKGQRYFPDKMPERRYYQPTDRGLEQRIREKLQLLRQPEKERGNKK